MTTTRDGTVEGLVIGGTRIEASDGGTFEVFDPSTGEVLARVAKATAADVDRAVAGGRARRSKSKAWGGMPPAERGRVLLRIAQKHP